jgi:hypothetical protein
MWTDIKIYCVWRDFKLQWRNGIENAQIFEAAIVGTTVLFDGLLVGWYADDDFQLLKSSSLEKQMIVGFWDYSIPILACDRRGLGECARLSESCRFACYSPLRVHSIISDGKRTNDKSLIKQLRQYCEIFVWGRKKENKFNQKA